VIYLTSDRHSLEQIPHERANNLIVSQIENNALAVIVLVLGHAQTTLLLTTSDLQTSIYIII
jgi:hypothetical protein